MENQTPDVSNPPKLELLLTPCQVVINSKLGRNPLRVLTRMTSQHISISTQLCGLHQGHRLSGCLGEGKVFQPCQRQRDRTYENMFILIPKSTSTFINLYYRNTPGSSNLEAM